MNTPLTPNRRHSRARSAGLVAVAASAVLAAAPAAHGFDTGPHSELTGDALASEGFGTTATQVAQVNNWFVDLYENAESLSHSGHGGFFVTALGGGYGDREHWPEEVWRAADRSHFDGTSTQLTNTAEMTREWNRLRLTTAAELRAARDRNDPLSALTALGISLHQVEDFYSHTNWLEAMGPTLVSGPGWAQKGYGTTPTWFDIPASVREREVLYTGGAPGIPRPHGSWKEDDNASLAHGNAKDWPGRPLYTEAHTAAYFAARQWVQAARSWVANDGFWRQVQGYSNRGGNSLDHDVRGALRISVFSGHWQGQGEACRPTFSTQVCGARSGPGGSLVDLRFAVNDYFEDHAKTTFRSSFEQMIPKIAAVTPPASPTALPVPSSQDMQRQTRFARLQVTRVDEVDDRDLGPVDQAEFYARATIGGQAFRSATIFGKDHFGFERPNAPFTFLKSVTNGSLRGEPLRSLLVEVRTASAFGSGTDDDVYLRINPSTRFQLDKRLYDDFERGDRDTYSLPIDDIMRSGATVGDIQFLQIEKSRDGRLGGAWKLGGVRVTANDRVIYANDRVETWVEKNRLALRMTGFTPASPQTRAIPIQLQLWDDDAVLTGEDDHTDINPLVGRRDAAFAFDTFGPTMVGEARGGSRYGGRLGDGDVAKLNYRIDTVVPVVASPGLPIGSDLPVSVVVRPDLAGSAVQVLEPAVVTPPRRPGVGQAVTSPQVILR